MRVYLNCRSKLLDHVLTLYLGDLIAKREDADIEISDSNSQTSLPLCRIGTLRAQGHIKRPITQRSLLNDLSEYIERLQAQSDQ